MEVRTVSGEESGSDEWSGPGEGSGLGEGSGSNNQPDEVGGVSAGNTAKLGYHDWIYLTVFSFGIAVYLQQLMLEKSPLEKYSTWRNCTVTSVYLFYSLSSISIIMHESLCSSRKWKEKASFIHPAIGIIMLLQFATSMVVYGSKFHYISAPGRHSNLTNANIFGEIVVHWVSVAASCLLASMYSVCGVIDNMLTIYLKRTTDRENIFCFAAMIVVSILLSIPNFFFEVFIRNKLSSAPCEKYLHGSCQYFFYANAFFSSIWNTGKILTLFDMVLAARPKPTQDTVARPKLIQEVGGMFVACLLISTTSLFVTMYPSLYKELRNIGLNSRAAHISALLLNSMNAGVFFAFHLSRKLKNPFGSDSAQPASDYISIARSSSHNNDEYNTLGKHAYNFASNYSGMITILALHVRIGDLASTSDKAISEWDPDKKYLRLEYDFVFVSLLNRIFFLLLSRAGIELKCQFCVINQTRLKSDEGQCNDSDSGIDYSEKGEDTGGLEAGVSGRLGVFASSEDDLEAPLIRRERVTARTPGS